MDAVAASVGSGRAVAALQYDYISSQVVAVGAAAASSTAFLVPYTAVAISSTTNCWFSVGGTAAIHTAGSDYLPAGQKWFLKIPAGATISVIQDTAAGFLSITPMTNQTPAPLLLDAVPATVAAYSLRKLTNAWSGACINVRRSSDNATQTIGFSGNDLNVAAFNSFVGAGQGFVTTWYDQSGNGNHLAQATVANQPQLITSVAALGGKPAILFGDNSTIYLYIVQNASLTGIFATGGTASFVATVLTATSTNNDRLWARGAQFQLKYTATGTYLSIVQAASTTNGAWNWPIFAVGGHVVDLTYNYSNLANVPTMSYDGAAQTLGGTTVQPVGTISDAAGPQFGVGGAGSLGWNGHLAEVMFWKSLPVMAPIRTNQKAYWGTP